jgi:hypothetical protein
MRMQLKAGCAEDTVAQFADLAVLPTNSIATIGTMQQGFLRASVARHILRVLCLDHLAAFQHQCASVLIKDSVQQCHNVDHFGLCNTWDWYC